MQNTTYFFSSGGKDHFSHTPCCYHSTLSYEHRGKKVHQRRIHNDLLWYLYGIFVTYPSKDEKGLYYMEKDLFHTYCHVCYCQGGAEQNDVNAEAYLYRPLPIAYI